MTRYLTPCLPIRRIVVAASVLWLGLFSACTSYKPPAGEPTARLRVVTQGGNSTRFSVYDLQSCPGFADRLMHHYFSGFIPMPFSKLGMPGGDELPMPSNQAESVIPAGRPLVLFSQNEGGYGGYGSVCAVAAKFEPKAGQDYEARYVPQPRGCLLSLTALQTDATAKVTRERVPGVEAVRVERNQYCSVK